MRINRSVWLELTVGERIEVLKYAASENRKKWKSRRPGRPLQQKLIKLLSSILP